MLFVGQWKSALFVRVLVSGQGNEKRYREIGVTGALPDGHRAVSSSSDATLRLWDIDTGESLAVIAGADWVIETVEHRFPI